MLQYGWRLLLGLTLLGVLFACASQTWQESFDDVGDWLISSDAAADVTVADGQLVVHIRQPGQLAWARTDRSFKNFHLTVDATQVSGPLDNEYGVLFRMDGDNSFYVFSISGDGYVRVAHYDRGTWLLLGSDWTPSTAIQQGAATNRLEIVAEGSTLTFWVNGVQVTSVTGADALRRGDIGLYAGAFNEPGVVIAFDNLIVEPLP